MIWTCGSLTLGACHDHATFGGDIDTGDCLVVPFELILKSEFGAGPSVKLDVVVPSDGERLPVGGERVVGDWVMKEMMNFWTCHV